MANIKLVFQSLKSYKHSSKTIKKLLPQKAPTQVLEGSVIVTCGNLDGRVEQLQADLRDGVFYLEKTDVFRTQSNN